MQILVDEARCSGCRACEIACVARHDGAFGTSTARIRVTKVEADGLDRPGLCRQCADAPCVAACPAGALERDAATGAIRLLAAACIACPACADACPFGALWLGPNGLPLVCDLCDGEPACVGRCVTGALEIAAAGSTDASSRRPPRGRGGDRV